MPQRFLILQLALALVASAQIRPPALGVARDPGGQVVELQGVPEAWVARRALDGQADAAASSSAQVCWTTAGTLHIRDAQTGKVSTHPVPEGDARFAFDTKGQLTAAWFLNTGEVYARAAGWNAIYVSPEGAAPLDLKVADARALMLLSRSEAGLRRTRIDAASGGVLGEMRLDDRSGPALLDAGGDPVFAASSGLAQVQSMRRIEQDWILLSTAHGLWLWQPGKRPQSVPTATSATSALQFWTANGTTDVGDTLALPSTPVGSSTQPEYVLVNQGSTDIYLSSFHMTTAAPFSLVGAPQPPWRIGAGRMQGFYIKFSPTVVGAATPGSLTINYCYASDFDTTSNACPASGTITRSIALTGTGTVAPVGSPWLTGISPESNMAGAPAFKLTVNGGGFTSGSTVQWNGTPLATTYISALQLVAAVPANLLTTPDETEVTVSNPPGGTANVTKAWTFHIYNALTPSIALFDQNDVPLAPSQLASNMTVRVRVKLDQAPTTTLAGTLQLGFQSAVDSVTTDQSIALGSSGSDQQVGSLQQFTVPSGAGTALFGNADYVTLTTGTTAGVVTLAVGLQYALPASPESYTIAPTSTVVTKSARVSTAATTVVTIEGYDNTRSASSISFTFYTASGAVVSPGAMTVDVTKDFASYFQANAEIGGSFALTATFPVSGDISQIASVTATLTNNAGTATVRP